MNSRSKSKKVSSTKKERPSALKKKAPIETRSITKNSLQNGKSGVKKVKVDQSVKKAE